MFYNNYRFHLADDLQFPDPEQTSEQIRRILNGATDLEIMRVAINLSGQYKSVSLLCPFEEDSELQSKVIALLLAEGFTIEKTENERLKDQDECDHARHEEHSHGQHHEHEHEHHHGHSHEEHHGHSHGHHHGHSHDNHGLKAALGLVWGLGLIILSLSGLSIPIIAYYILTGLTTLMTLYLGRTIYQSAWNALRELRWDMTTLYAISTLTIVVVSLLSLFIPGLPMMFEAAPLVLGFWHLGEKIEHSLIDRINEKLDVREGIPTQVLLKGNPNRLVSIKTLIPNDIIIIKKGSVIPVDGILTTNASSLNDSRIYGAKSDNRYTSGQAVISGMYDEDIATDDAAFEMRVTHTYQKSHLSLMAKSIKEATDEKAPLEEWTQKILKYFIPGLLGVALVSGLVIGIFFTPALAIQCVISVLVSACPCALSLITPMAVSIGMTKAFNQGAPFKDGKALQAAADIDTVVFDLHGTLTQSAITVRPYNLDRKFFGHVALLEKQSNHATAKAISTYIESEGFFSSEQLELCDFDDTHHSGVKGMINGELFMIGNQKMLFDNGITINEPYDNHDNHDNGSTYFVQGTRVIGQIDVNYPLRDDAVAAIQQLKRQGISVHICTGADEATAKKYARLLGVSENNICAHAVGVEKESDENSKTNYIKKLQSMGHKVAMAGDNTNDTAAMTRADLSIAVKSSMGNNSVQKNAGIKLLEGKIFPLATAFDIAKKTKRNIFQNLFVSLTYNSTITLVAAGIFVALGFVLNPAVGVALMVLESTIVLANLARFRYQDVVTAKSNNVNKVPDEMDSETTTSRILNALGCYSRPKTEATRTAEPGFRNATAGAFFTPLAPVSVITEDTVNGMLPQ